MRTEYERATSIFSSESQASGIVSASSQAGLGYKPWYAFNGQLGYDSQTWATTNNLPQWIQYKFPSPVCITRIITVNRNEDSGSVHNNRAVSDFTLQGSNDGSNWTNIQNCTITSSASHYKETIDIQNQNEYLYYRLYITNNFNNATGTGCGFAEVEMYKTVKIYEYGGTAGDIKAIGDWFRGTRYSKGYIDSFFILNNSYKPYLLRIHAKKGSTVTITGQTSGNEYSFEMSSYVNSKLLFFENGETITIVNGTKTITKTLSDSIDDIYLSVYLFIDGEFPHSVKSVNVNNYAGPFRWSTPQQQVSALQPYFFSDKMLLGGYNCNMDLKPEIDSDKCLTQNIVSSYGPNNTIYTPVPRINHVFSKLSITAKRYNGQNTRLYPSVATVSQDQQSFNGYGGGLSVLTDSFVTYERDISAAPYIDYFHFLVEQGKPLIKEIWLE